MPALFTQQSVRAVLGSDVRSALDRLELVDSALATLRRREIERWSSEPAEYFVPCLDPAERSRPRATVAAGHRRDRGLATVVGVSDGSDSPNAWTRALGPPSEGWEGEGADASSRTCGGATRSRSRGDVALGPLTPVLCSTRRRLRCRAR